MEAIDREDIDPKSIFSFPKTSDIQKKSTKNEQLSHSSKPLEKEKDKDKIVYIYKSI